LAAVFTVATVLTSGVYGIGKVARNGRYLFNADGSRFYIKGIAYQEQGTLSTDPNNPFLEPSDFIDPLANGTACARDLPFLQQLGVNTIRVYSVNASLNHDSCMQAFSQAGIYTIIDLSLPVNGSIDRSAPAWTTNLLDLYINTIDVFSKYDNVLAYNVGNEVVTAPNETDALTFVKAAARDTKAYLKSKSQSALVGYGTIDGDIEPYAAYLSCDPSGSNSDSTSIDIFGLNNYEWCGNSTFEASYSQKTTQFANYNVVAYFSEFGCNNPSPRIWTEVAALFSSQMSDVWSGGLAFSYFPATSSAGQFGMITLSADGSTVQTSTDFDNLKTQYGQISAPNSPSSGTNSFPSCPQSSDTLLVSNTLPPTPNDQACQCLQNSLSCQFNPQTTNTSAIVGPLLDEACSLIGGTGGSCSAISANGTSGQFGAVSSCDPSVKLSFVMSQYFEANNRDPMACSFGGNGTVNGNAPTSASAANAAASSCVASATGTFVPTATAPSGGSSSGGSNGNNPSNTPGAATSLLLGDSRGLLGIVLMCAVSLAGGLWTLA